jgi:hypothetical protein
MSDFVLNDEQWEFLQKELNRPATKEEIKRWKEAIRIGRKIKVIG